MRERPYETLQEFLAANQRVFSPLGQKSEAARRILAQCRDGERGGERLVVLHGTWAHEKALAAGLCIQTFLLCPSLAKWPEVAELSGRTARAARRCYTITERTFARISDYGDPDGILSLARLPDTRPEALNLGEGSVVFVMDGLTKPGNIGVILRSCDGAGVNAVLACNLRTRITHPNAVKASMGAAFTTPVAEFPDAAACRDWLLDHGFTVYIADPNVAYRYDATDFARRTAVVLGNEHIGPSRIWYDGRARPLSIPMRGACDSLNVSVAAAVLAYAIMGKR